MDNYYSRRMFLGQLKKSFLYNTSRLGFRIFNFDIQPYPTVSAIIVKGGKILTIKVSKDHYTLPGGMLKGQESFEDGLKREVFEETGLYIGILKLQGQYAFKKIYPTINLTYFAKVIKGKLKPSPEGKPIWLKANKIIDKLIYLDNKAAIKEYLEKKR